VIKPEKILLPHDLTEISDVSVCEIENRFADVKRNAEVLFVHKAHAPVLDFKQWKQIEKQINQQAETGFKKIRAKHKGLKFFQGYGDPATEIIKRAKKFDLVALTPRTRRTHFATLGSVTTKIVRSLHEPILVFPAMAEKMAASSRRRSKDRRGSVLDDRFSGQHDF
jgi:nucleotide-binding universal stress UspA family protein